MRGLFAGLVAVLVVLPGMSCADGIAGPGAEVILTVSEKVVNTNSANNADIDHAIPEALPQHTIKTHTAWHEGEVTFEGPFLTDVMALAGGKGEMVTVSAPDDHTSDVLISTFAKDRPILAMNRNGEWMPDDEQGPLFIIYDYDSKPETNTEAYQGYPIWSVRKIELKWTG